MQHLVQEIPLKIKTFSNTGGSSALFKALGHPLTSVKMQELLTKLRTFRKVIIYDPFTAALELEALYDLTNLNISDVFVQNLADIGHKSCGHYTKPITGLKNSDADALFITAFDAKRLIEQIQHLIPSGMKVFSFDHTRLPDEFLTNSRNYTDGLNFATNFVFFREEAGHHTRLVTANYWAGYSQMSPSLWCCLFDKDGKILTQWHEKLGNAVHNITLDSRQIKQRFNLPDFCGSLFIHFSGIANHDVVKYALDTYGDNDTVLSCTHDANSWPSDYYAGLPAPKPGQKVLLWLQNCHPCAIPANGMGLSLMGSDEFVGFTQEIPAFATRGIDISTYFPNVQWPSQFQVHAGKYVVRPRYEVIDEHNRLLIAHTNVERTDLKVDPSIYDLPKEMGKGYILPAPILPPQRWQNFILPTPMSSCQQQIALILIIYNSKGKEIKRLPLGMLSRGNIKDIHINAILGSKPDFPDGYGHAELVYDFTQEGDADGWLHALMRYEDTQSGHHAETSFGSHIFNTMLVYKNEPQSYTGKAPGLTTRLFLRLANDEDTDTLCHLIYPVSASWHPQSTTELILHDAQGQQIIKKTVHIPSSGSLLWRYHELFSFSERQQAGPNAYIIIRDITCRLFGYHGLIRGEKAFCIDHMFGF